MADDPSPPPRTEGYWLKLERAVEHLNALQAEVTAFISRNPYDVVRHFEVDATGEIGRHIIRIQAREAPPPRWSLIVGDYIHNLRSALDYLIWDISFRRTGDHGIRTEFPIFDNWNRFHQAGTKERKWDQRSGMHKLRAVDGTIHMLVEAMQPYRGQDLHGRTVEPILHPLWMLHKLSNADKHKALDLVGTVMQRSLIVFQRRDGAVLKQARAFVEEWSGPFEDGAVLGGLHLPTTEAGEQDIEFEADVTFDIAFSRDGPGRGLPALPTLYYIGDAVNAVLTILDGQMRAGRGASS